MQATHTDADNRPSWLDKPLSGIVTLNWETVLFAAIVILAVFTRFYDLGARVMSHDESLHTFYSWQLYKGFGFEHTPLMHGPLQFHFIALSYFLFGDSDFSARIFAAVTSIATVLMMWKFRRYLGRKGALIAALLLTISPYMMYYGRYVRNEAYVGLFGVAALWAILRYLDTGENKYLFYLTAATVLHFTAKETAFIYTAQALIFLGLLFVRNVTMKEWPNPDQRNAFLIVLIVAFICFAMAGGIYFGNRGAVPLSATDVAAPANPDETLPIADLMSTNNLALVFGGVGSLAMLTALFFLLVGFGLDNLRKERSFGLVILLFSLVLPQLSPFISVRLGWNPLDYSSTGILHTALLILPLALLSVALGWLFNLRIWLLNAAIFYGVFVVFYTTIFTNGQGFFTGMVGSLGYWLEQQAVKRGSQPWYYYILVQVPLYEYLPALGGLLALAVGGRRWWKSRPEDGGFGDEEMPEVVLGAGAEPAPAIEKPLPLPEAETALTGRQLIAPLLGFWALTALSAYTIAGEKMPWLTFHIALPLILLSGWSLGQVADRIDWAAFVKKRGLTVLALFAVFIVSFFATWLNLLGDRPPFQGSELAQLQATLSFAFAFIMTLASAAGLFLLARSWEAGQLVRVALLGAFVFLGILTTRSAVTATFINYDRATEYLVYAHSAGPVKEVLAQAEEISRRTTGDLTMAVAYDDDVSWPFTWYMRNFPNKRFYGGNPERNLRDVPIIIVGDNNFAKLLPIVGQAYYQFDYIRMWWPNQDYFNLTPDRVLEALTDREMRSALFNIWLNRDYTLYSQKTGVDMSLANWSPSDRMRMYIRKDVAAGIWEFGVGPAAEELVADPYEDRGITLQPDRYFGAAGDASGQFNAPRGLAVAADGSIYVADSRNHRIQHLAADGTPIAAWGSFADAALGPAPGGTFNEPWDVAVGPDGSVYVADTWNHRIQKFSPDGEFITMWGFFGTAETPDAFWGPRSIAIDSAGRLYISDTGNKRIVIFDPNGGFITEFGSLGFAPGQFDEPVGVAVDAEGGRLYVADTWNQRMQVFSLDGSPITSWDIFGWFGNSLENKPYIAVDSVHDRLYIADPESYRVLEYTLDGEFIRYWGDYSTGVDGFGLVSGLALDPQGGLWVSDGVNNRLLHFIPAP